MQSGNGDVFAAEMEVGYGLNERRIGKYSEYFLAIPENWSLGLRRVGQWGIGDPKLAGV